MQKSQRGFLENGKREQRRRWVERARESRESLLCNGGDGSWMVGRLIWEVQPGEIWAKALEIKMGAAVYILLSFLAPRHVTES